VSFLLEDEESLFAESAKQRVHALIRSGRIRIVRFFMWKV